MFDFLDSDWFIIGLEIVFLLFIAYDYKLYKETKKKEYLTNIALAVVFAVWTLMPFYNSYYGWSDTQKVEYATTCKKEDNATTCKCLCDSVFKEYTFKEYSSLDKKSEDFQTFVKGAKEDCYDESWF